MIVTHPFSDTFQHPEFMLRTLLPSCPCPCPDPEPLIMAPPSDPTPMASHCLTFPVLSTADSTAAAANTTCVRYRHASPHRRSSGMSLRQYIPNMSSTTSGSGLTDLNRPSICLHEGETRSRTQEHCQYGGSTGRKKFGFFGMGDGQSYWSSVAFVVCPRAVLPVT